MASAMRILSVACTLLLVAVFTLVGVMKLTPVISPEIHSQMVSWTVLASTRCSYSSCLASCSVTLQYPPSFPSPLFATRKENLIPL